MNERLKELAKQAKPSPNLIWEDAELERFAELVRQDERELCAKLCDVRSHRDNDMGAILARLIRARGTE